MAAKLFTDTNVPFSEKNFLKRFIERITSKKYSAVLTAEIRDFKAKKLRLGELIVVSRGEEN